MVRSWNVQFFTLSKRVDTRLLIHILLESRSALMSDANEKNSIGNVQANGVGLVDLSGLQTPLGI